MEWLKSKYCYHPWGTAVAMMFKDGYKQKSRKQCILWNGTDEIINVPEPVMKLIRKRKKDEKTKISITHSH